MTDEAAFHVALDADPTDWQTRLVFADWLQDRDDPRAEGYRAIGLLKLQALRTHRQEWDGHNWFMAEPTWGWMGADTGRCHNATLRRAWWNLLKKVTRKSPIRFIGEYKSNEYASRREAEDDAALAFSRLPESRRASLLREAAHR